MAQGSLLPTPPTTRLAVPGEDERSIRPRSDRSRSTSRTRTWQCEIAGCSSTANFTRLADLQRHQSTVHGIGTPEFPCTQPRCSRVGDKGFTRKDHLVEHLRNFHHLNIPKRQPGERSAGGIPQYPSS
ncbi:hypothetical protein P154DRAFT_15071 [Amniculicola lignicola CBS 123094]|uniref:C2H2-type domain-containing protein n=1 Tax=Amniculicola lignicola CBS 123094 TaxID=1392246 RepID=A0A6A5X526_9PLEO|nr:hypothetical protein P154DRAFT_15071 [Amniculicola lignicola CBS 123094]